MKITVLGTGSWGTALAKVLCDNGAEVTLWGRDDSHIKQMGQSGYNKRYLADFLLPENLSMTSSLKGALQNCELLVNVVPVQYTRNILEQVKNKSQRVPIIVNASKGIEIISKKCVSKIVGEIFGSSIGYAVLSGPSHAEEVMRGCATSVVVASDNSSVASVVQEQFKNDFFRVYTSSDVIGVEVAGAFKNIYAIAAGAVDAMNLGDNTKAALITRSIAEMTRLGVALGGREKTFAGLSGIGDLIVTCMSKFSRNRFVGECLAKQDDLETIKKKMGTSVAEGVSTIKSAYQIIQTHQISAPIIEQSYQVIYGGSSIADVVKNLMMREAKREF